MMRRWRFIAPAALVWSLLFGPACAGQAPLTPPTTLRLAPAQFLVFDGTYFTNKPDLSAYGIQPLNLVYENPLFPANSPTDAMPQASDIKSVDLQCVAAKGITVLDIERWIGLPDAVGLYAGLIANFKILSPQLKLGYYSLVPENDYWRAISGPNSAQHLQWQQENNQLQAIADQVDYLFPSLYTFYADQTGWVAYAEANIAEARRLAKGKPVYAFLWFDYHNSNATLGGTPIPPDFWRLELDTVRRLADGVVIWGGGGNWDPNAAWWLATREFMVSLQNP